MSKTSYVLAEEPAVDLAIAEAFANELEEYIVGENLYRTMIVRTPRWDENLQMTGGDLLTRLRRLQGERALLAPEDETRLDAVQKLAETTIYSLRSRFHQRLQREAKARLSSLKWFLDDCAQDTRRCRVEFPFEMRNRQRIEEILREVGDELSPELREQLTAIDKRIRGLTHSAPFIWDERLKEIFPPHPYWYLYVLPA
ncbi:MAG: hypothetical protein HC802_00380 [Caldilineaceae bacterium]|nr:hypothetical protein [Caldilineaceae bacterium]